MNGGGHVPKPAGSLGEPVGLAERIETGPLNATTLSAATLGAAAMERCLAAILVADVVGYTRLSEMAEEETHRGLRALHRGIIEPLVGESGGRIVKNTGDGFIASFPQAEAAADCALALQGRLALATEGEPEASRLTFRMGVNLAEVIVEDGDVFGDGVNVAARLQAYAEAGDVIVSEAVFARASAAARARATDLGALPLRNHARPVRVFALRCGEAARPRAGECAPGAEARATIAVLPFRTGAPDRLALADGFTDWIVRALSSLRDLFVISRGSTLAYRRRRSDPAAFGRRLGVRYVMDGAIQHHGDTLRVCTALIECGTGAVVSADHHEGRVDEVFALQDTIALRLIRNLAPHVRQRELQRALRKHPASLTSYDLLLQALDQLHTMEADSFGRAGGLLQQAIALDPSYAPPFAYAAWWHVLRVGEMGSPDPEGDARAAAERARAAIARDGDDPLALAIYGHVQAFLLRDFATARHFLDRAIEAGPSVAIAWTMSSAAHGFTGDGRHAVAHGEIGQRLAPRDPYTFWHEGLLAQAHYVAGDYDAALAWASSAVARNRAIRFTLRILAASLAAAGRRPAARTAAAELLRLQPDFRLGAYAPRCPFAAPVLARWLGHLREAGLPD
ncbi:adenylate/guanylate cyclase domain-containing protein [Methylobacterium terricola]|uniref:Adenylate/guanylate cyclase domain-containing protein n=1 Tax=Methylobacterium terricola TaxID=2583531 RepID=A0A5C4LKY4_9HYPH|nr:adenylate/guanylate cyclase domain-containing protein [Methylobacterium terricola]TNC15167.1 adenylate/guanylate cyclase domain-containing protein [Methylobacterium terricola]